MPKGKKCNVCNEGRMRRCYTRSYYEGFKFTEEYVAGIQIPKGRFEPKGWICESCGYFIPDQEDYLMFLYWNRRKEETEKIIETLKNKVQELEEEFNEYKIEYIHTERDLEIERKMMLYKFWNLRSEIGTYQYLKGLRAGNKQSDKSYEEKIKEMELTDNQILKKAKLIEIRKKIGFT